jgi:hypothetical protein
MDEEYRKAIATTPRAVNSEVPPLVMLPSQRLMLHDSAIKTGATLLLGAMGGITVKTFLRKRG